MAKIGYQLMPPEYEDYFKNNLSPNWRFELPRIMRTNRMLSRKKKKQMIEKSRLSEIAELWNGLSPAEKTEWEEAAAVRGWYGWKLFVQNKCVRIAKGLSGVGTPSLKHQGYNGRIDIVSPATSIKLTQPHPNYYWLPRVIAGRYPLIEIVWINEPFSLPLTIGLNYRAELEPLSGDAFASFYASIWSVAEGQDYYTDLKIPLSFLRDWTSVEDTISNVYGEVVSYSLFFELSDVRGSLFFDNIKSEHSGYNWTRDPFSSSIDAEYSRSFFQVLTPWVAVDLPSGASYYSDYLDFDDLSSSAFYGLGDYGLSCYGII